MYRLVLVIGSLLIPALGWGADPDWSKIETIVEAGIKAGEMPGAVVVVADQEKVLYRRAFGDRQVEPTREPMTVETVFDMASITKPVATAMSVMILVQQKKVDVDQPVQNYLPEFGAAGKSEITVADAPSARRPQLGCRSPSCQGHLTSSIDWDRRSGSIEPPTSGAGPLPS